MNLKSLIIGLIVGIIVKYALDLIGVPSPIDWLVALLVFFVIAFGNDIFTNWRI